MPNSRLLTSHNWGHTAYGTSAGATTAVDANLLRGTLPAKGKACVTTSSPFLKSQADTRAARTLRTGMRTKAQLSAGGLPAEGEPKHRPPVSLRLPMPRPVAGR